MISSIKKGLVATAFAATLATTGLQATEGGGGAYPNGAEGFMAGAVPPPGLYYLNYLTNYSADALMDNNGDEQAVDFKLNATANVSRIVYTSPYTIFGGYWGAQVLVPLVTVSASLNINPGPGQIFDESDTGLGDIVIDPFLVSWHSKNLHQAIGMDIIIPSGSYDKTNPASVGRNYYTFEPIYAVTYISDSGWEASSKFLYDFNTENSDTNYKSGQEFHFDYAFGKHINKDWTVGVGGYYYQQITDDEQNGETVEDNKGQVLAVGPQVQYNYGKLSFIGKYQVETNVKNRPKGNKAWFKLIWPL